MHPYLCTALCHDLRCMNPETFPDRSERPGEHRACEPGFELFELRGERKRAE